MVNPALTGAASPRSAFPFPHTVKTGRTSVQSQPFTFESISFFRRHIEYSGLTKIGTRRRSRRQYR
ncbi:hypothetical protein BWZ27_05380 [Neisseria meningitidis]|nr:hypothetical protein BWZ27_05380 [Neisseria meningitidis]OMH48217.1 hypothetical protein BWZ31_09170 [Neisseria meningitidis]